VTTFRRPGVLNDATSLCFRVTRKRPTTDVSLVIAAVSTAAKCPLRQFALDLLRQRSESRTQREDQGFNVLANRKPT
jgi:hypothetical protein